MYEVEEVLMAVGITALIVISLTMFAFQSKYDMTMKSGMLLAAVSSMLVFSIIGIFYRGEFFHFVIACLGATTFAMYIIYDTQLMMGGEHKYQISPEEYVFAGEFFIGNFLTKVLNF
jgi:FtsH-binding integral membrane protein